MTIFQSFERTFKELLTNITTNKPENHSLERVTVSIPSNPLFGDLTTNAAMVLAKSVGHKPRELAELLAQHIRNIPDIQEVNIEGPGFINIHLDSRVWYTELAQILKQGIQYGDCDIGEKQKVHIEYVSANPTGPLHVAHARGAVFGDVLANLLRKAGFEVTREFYVNDTGNQVNILARSVYKRYLEILGVKRDVSLDGLYPGNYLRVIANRIVKTYGQSWVDVPENAWLPVIRTVTIEYLLSDIQKDLQNLGVVFDCYTSEQSLVDSGMVTEVIGILRDQGYIYEGILKQPLGHQATQYECRPQMLFRATSFGDDLDRPLLKADGTGTYFVHDIAYHFDKFCRGFDKQIDIWGADHGGYVKRLQGALAAVTQKKATLDIKLCQLVHILEDGKAVRMSKRTGQFVTLRSLIQEVGRDVIRFIMLTRRHDQTLECDCKKVTQESRDNMAFYVQYAHARCHSVLRYAQQMFGSECLEPSFLTEIPLSVLTHHDEIALIRLLAEWPKLVRTIAHNHELHRITYYLYDVASSFHELWTKGKKDATLRFLIPDQRMQTLARVALIKAVATVIASGLQVMGVSPVEELRQ